MKQGEVFARVWFKELLVGDGQVSPWEAITRTLSGLMTYPGTGSGVIRVGGFPPCFKCFYII